MRRMGFSPERAIDGRPLRFFGFARLENQFPCAPGEGAGVKNDAARVRNEAEKKGTGRFLFTIFGSESRATHPAGGSDPPTRSHQPLIYAYFLLVLRLEALSGLTFC